MIFQNSIEVSLDNVKSRSIIDVKGDLISYENMTESIRVNGVLIPIILDKDYNVIKGNRKVFISKELGLKTIPALIVDDNISEIEIEKLKIDFFLTHRNLSYLDIVQIYYHQKYVFKKHNESYTEYMRKLEKCSRRDIQDKVRCGKVLKTLPIEFKNKLQEIDAVKKVPLTTLQLMYKLENDSLDKFVNEVISIDGNSHKDLVPITKKYKELSNLQIRNKKINEDIKKEASKNEIISLNDDILSQITDGVDGSDNEVINSVKKVFKYEIKKHFKLEIDTNEENDIQVIKSQFDIDLKEEIELIKSLLEEGKNA
jgi:hypothetical protein